MVLELCVASNSPPRSTPIARFIRKTYFSFENSIALSVITENNHEYKKLSFALLLQRT